MQEEGTGVGPPRERASLRALRVPWLPLLAVLVAGAALRLYGLNWDGGQWLHPDERQIYFVALGLGRPESLAQALSAESPLNPGFFAYGSLPIYLLRLAAGLLAPLPAGTRVLLLAGGRERTALSMKRWAAQRPPAEAQHDVALVLAELEPLHTRHLLLHEVLDRRRHADAKQRQVQVLFWMIVVVQQGHPVRQPDPQR